MNIYAKQGSKVIFSNPNAGYDFDQQRAGEHLEVGKVYTVRRTEVQDSSSQVFLEEVPAIGFNTVLFTDAPHLTLVKS